MGGWGGVGGWGLKEREGERGGEKGCITIFQLCKHINSTYNDSSIIYFLVEQEFLYLIGIFVEYQIGQVI